MSVIFKTIAGFAGFFGGDSGPAGLVEKRYMLEKLPATGRIADIGGGEGRLARAIAAPLRSIVVLDREETLLPGSDNSIYEGSLRRLLKNRGSLPIIPIQGDATAFPIASESLDGIVSCQLLEHLESGARELFFKECARCLRPGGVLAISTPNAAMYEIYKFWVSPLSRQLIPEGKRKSMPRSLQGPWLLQSLEEWEAKVGHFGHGCPVDELAEQARGAGLVEHDRRGSHTKLTAFWFEVACTLPLLAMIAAPLVRVLYEIEWRLPAEPGVNLLMRFQKPAASELEIQ